jgi:hypothetical protein
LPSGPVVMSVGPALDTGNANSVIDPAGVILPILLARGVDSTNQRLPSGPAVIPRGKLSGDGIRNLATTVGIAATFSCLGLGEGPCSAACEQLAISTATHDAPTTMNDQIGRSAGPAFLMIYSLSASSASGEETDRSVVLLTDYSLKRQRSRHRSQVVPLAAT